MIIKLADNAGFCFGVKKAVEKTEDALKNNSNVQIAGDLIHNKSVTSKLKSMGLKNYETIPSDATVIIRSHGESKNIKEKIIENNNTLIDCTCPVLLNIYKKIEEKDKSGYRLIIIGDKNHPEVIAMNGHIDGKAVILNTVEEAKKIRLDEKLYIISQTTNRSDHFYNLANIIAENNHNTVIDNTICGATKNRQDSCRDLAKTVDLMVVIGGKNSSNTEKLYQIANEYCDHAIKIESTEELDFIDFFQYNSIGITAGASTPSWIIEEVINFMDNYSKDEFLEQIEDSMTKIYPKDVVKGEVIYVTEDEVIVNINYKSDGIVTLNELSNDENAKPKDLFEEGQEIEVYVIKLDDGEGNVVLSTRRVEGLRNWHSIVEAYENEEPIKVTLNKEVKGGLIGNYKGIVVFIPGSQIKTYFVKDLSQFIGEELECKILSIDEKKRRIVASSRVLEEEKKNKEIEEFWDTFEEGDTLTGKVARLVDFGAFVNLGPMDGLIHISDISWNRIKNPSDVLEIDQEIEVIVLKKDKDKKRVSLGYKQLESKPFEKFLENNKDGDVVKGKVVNLVDFGAFVRLEEGVEGLVHVSEISHNHVEKPSDELEIDQEIEVKILSVHPEEKRIALSIKALEEKPVVEQAKPKKKKVEKQAPKKVQEPAPEQNTAVLDTSIGALIDLDLDNNNEADKTEE